MGLVVYATLVACLIKSACDKIVSGAIIQVVNGAGCVSSFPDDIVVIVIFAFLAKENPIARKVWFAARIPGQGYVNCMGILGG